MKTKGIILTTLIFSVLTAGQTYAQILLKETQITPPKFPAKEFVVQGQTSASLDEYLSKHVQYPGEAFRDHQIGTEVIRFEVSATGDLGGFYVINSVSPEIDRAVIRVLETTSGQWIPGFINGEPVDMTQEVSLVFKTNNNYDMAGMARNYQDKGNKKLFVKKDPRSALKYYNQAIRLLPHEESFLAARSLCKYELGDERGAVRDLERILALHPASASPVEAEALEEIFAQLKKDAELSYQSK